MTNPQAKRRSATAASIAAVCVLAVGGSATAEVVDKVAAVVNNDIIALSEVQQRAAPELVAANQARDPKQRAELRKRAVQGALDQLIAEKLMEGEMEELGITVTEEELEVALDNVRKQNNVQPEQFEQALMQEGYTLQTYKDFMRKHLRRMKLVNLKVRSKVALSDKELQAEYARWARMEQADPEVHARHILVKLSPDADAAAVEEARKKAAEISAKARKQGVDFVALAKEQSEGSSARDGGDLGFFRRGVMVPEFDKVVFNLPVGGVSDPIRTRSGWHVVKVEDKRQVPVKSFEEMKPELQERLLSGQLEKYTQQYVKELRQQAIVDVRI